MKCSHYQQCQWGWSSAVFPSLRSHPGQLPCSRLVSNVWRCSEFIICHIKLLLLQTIEATSKHRQASLTCLPCSSSSQRQKFDETTSKHYISPHHCQYIPVRETNILPWTHQSPVCGSHLHRFVWRSSGCSPDSHRPWSPWRSRQPPQDPGYHWHRSLSDWTDPEDPGPNYCLYFSFILTSLELRVTCSRVVVLSVPRSCFLASTIRGCSWSSGPRGRESTLPPSQGAWPQRKIFQHA